MAVFGAAVSVVVAAVAAHTSVVVVVEEEETRTAAGATAMEAMEVVFGYVGNAILSQTPSHEFFPSKTIENFFWVKALVLTSC